MPANAAAWLVRGPAFGTIRPTAPSVASCGRSPSVNPFTITTRKTCRWCPEKSLDVFAAALPETTSARAHATRRARAAFTRTRLDEWDENRGAEGAGDPERPARRAGEECDPAGGRGGVRRHRYEAADPEHEADGGLDGMEGDAGCERVREGSSLRVQGNCDRAGGDPEVSGGERDEPGDVE